MRKHTVVGLVVVVAWALCQSNLYAAQGEEKQAEATQTKVGEVKSVDLAGTKIVVMVAREMTFTVTDTTKIRRCDDAKKLADIKVGGMVRVEYTRTGDNRIAKAIAILGDEEKK